VLTTNWTGYDTAALILGDYKLITNEVNETWWATPTSTDEDLRQPKIADGSGDDVFSFLFNLRTDPLETTDLSLSEPKVLQALTQRLGEFRANMVDALFCGTEDSEGNTAQLEGGGFIAPWVSDPLVHTCPERFLANGNLQYDYNPSFLNGQAAADGSSSSSSRKRRRR